MHALRFEPSGPQLVLDELNHRFLNSLQIISTLAAVSAADCDPECSAHRSQRLRDCIGALARLHRMLAGSEWTPFADGCVEVCRALTDAFGRPVSLDVHVDEEPDDASLSHGLLLVMAELMTNALKHAGAEPLIVAVTLSRSAWGWSLLVDSNTLGQSGRPRIAHALAAWLGGDLSVDAREGFAVSVTLPPRAPKSLGACA